MAGAQGCPGSDDDECVSLGGNKCPFPLGINPGMELLGWSNSTLVDQSVLKLREVWTKILTSGFS